MAVTQFAATEARRAFPCLDEPSFKAEFTLHVACQQDKTVTSNMPIESQPLM